MLYLVGLVYAALFWAVAYRHPKVALMLIFAAAPFQNDLSGDGPIKFSLAEINTLLAVPLFLLKRRPFTLGPMTGPMVFYFAVSFVCSLLSWRDTSLVSLVQMGLYYVVAMALFAHLVREPEDFRLALNGLICVGVFVGVAGILARSSYYLGLHKNGVGASLACAVVVGLELFLSASSPRRKWLYAGAMAILVMGLIFTLSRGAWLAAMVGTAFIFGLRRQLLVLVQAGLLMIPVVAIGWQYLPEDSREYATDLSTDRYSIKARFDNVIYAHRQWEKSPITGVGVGLRKEYDATNVLLLTLAETGLIGVAAMAMVHFALFRMVWKTQRLLDKSSTLFSLCAIGGALVLGRLAHGMVDHYWSRGAIMLAWAAAGMVVHAHFATKRALRLARWEAAQEEEEALLEETAAPSPS